MARSHATGHLGWGAIKRIVLRLSADNITLVAAGVAFYAMLAIFPALAALISICGLFMDASRIRDQIAALAALLPQEAMELLVNALQSFATNGADKLNTAFLIGLAIAVWSAKAGMSSLMTGLNIVNREPERRSLVVSELTALVLTLAAILFAIFALSAIAGLPIALNVLPLTDEVRTWLSLGRWPLLAIMVSLGIAVLYRFGPSKDKAEWRWMTWGAAIATALWIAGSLGLSYYVSNFGSYDATYGSLAAVVILLLWFWVGALVVLLGAEVDAELQGQRDTVPREDAENAPEGLAQVQG
jgi:membrane protein